MARRVGTADASAFQNPFHATPPRSPARAARKHTGTCDTHAPITAEAEPWPSGDAQMNVCREQISLPLFISSTRTVSAHHHTQQPADMDATREQ